MDVAYIDREEDNFKQKEVVDRQFPVRLAFAVTMHITQGITISAAAVSLRHIEHGMPHVALS